MHALVQALYWLSLSAWFGAALCSAIAPPIVLRVIRAADPTLPRVLRVNLDRQHSTLLASEVAGEIVLAMFRIEAICAAALLPTLIGQWFLVDRSGANVLLPLIVSGVYLIATGFVVYGWRGVWPKVVRHRAAYVEHADDPDLANPELDQFDRYNGELLFVIRNLVFVVLGVVLFSASLVPHVQMFAAPLTSARRMATKKTVQLRRERVAVILPILKTLYPDAKCSLRFGTPLELLVATILSAQCTDERVNQVTSALFARYRTAEDYAAADPAEIERFVQTCGFFRAKARNIRAMAAAVVERHRGVVPQTMDELHALAGVGRKTANVVLGNCFGINVGVTVDTHVTRLSNRLALTKTDDAVKIEQDLIPILPQEDRALWSNLLIHHGRAVCQARKPLCEACPLLPHCPAGPKVLRDRGEADAAVRKRR